MEHEWVIYCEECDSETFVYSDEEPNHCPICGAEASSVELGNEDTEVWDDEDSE